MSSVLDMLSLKCLLEKHVHIYVYIPTDILYILLNGFFFSFVDIFPYQDIKIVS